MGHAEFCIAPHAVVGSDVLHCLEGSDMAQVNQYVESLDREYRFLKVELEREVNKFELLRTQYNIKARQLTDDITRKWFELQRAKQESRHESV